MRAGEGRRKRSEDQRARGRGNGLCSKPLHAPADDPRLSNAYHRCARILSAWQTSSRSRSSRRRCTAARVSGADERGSGAARRNAATLQRLLRRARDDARNEAATNSWGQLERCNQTLARTRRNTCTPANALYTTQQHETTDGKKAAVDSEHADGGERLVWRRNDFPYHFEPGMQHWLLWAARELPRPRIEALVAERFPEAQWDAMHFTNPPVLQSVLAVWHCHVIVRPKAGAAAAAAAG